MHTPWGTSDHQRKLADGITFYGTPSHGGFHVLAAVNKTIPDHLRRGDGWYEEDCDWSLVATAFPQHFSAEDQAHAKDTLLNWYPAKYEAHYHVTIERGQSLKRDEEIMRREHANDYVALSAVGDWHPAVPKGMVGVVAHPGGRDEHGWYTADNVKNFLVPEEEYSQASRFGFVIDLARHQQVPADTFTAKAA